MTGFYISKSKYVLSDFIVKSVDEPVLYMTTGKWSMRTEKKSRNLSRVVYQQHLKKYRRKHTKHGSENENQNYLKRNYGHVGPTSPGPHGSTTPTNSSNNSTTGYKKRKKNSSRAGGTTMEISK